MTEHPSLAQVDWLTAPQTRRVIAALCAVRADGARFVGGCVRNGLIGTEPGDIDIATPLTPDAVIAAVEQAGLRAIPTGIEHGTVTVIADHRPFEVTTLRRDVSTDGRRATVAFTEDWAEDAARRDFTMNALYADPDGQVFDPNGQGLLDLASRQVRFIGDPARRIAEDYLRVLRFFRFSAWYGWAGLDPEGLAACAAAGPELTDFAQGRLSAERIWTELKKLFLAPEPLAAIQALQTLGLIPTLIGPGAWGDDQNRLTGIMMQEAEYFLPVDPLLRLAALAVPDGLHAAALAGLLKLSGDETARLSALAGPLPVGAAAFRSFLSPREVRRNLYHLGVQGYSDRVRLAWASDTKLKTTPQWRALLAHAAGYRRPKLPIGGDQVMAAGAPAGPVVGDILREVEAWWIDADFPDDPLAIVERLKAVTQALA